MNAKKLLISSGNIKVWFIDVQDLGGFCLFGCRQIHKLDREPGRAQNEHDTPEKAWILLSFFFFNSSHAATTPIKCKSLE
jgi:hypothetical protein